jgi:hypothetical protein
MWGLVMLFLCWSSVCEGQYFSKRYRLNRPDGFLSSLQVVNDTIYAMFNIGDSTGNKPTAAFAKFDKEGNVLSTSYFDLASRTDIGTNINTLIRTKDGGFAYGGWTQSASQTLNSLLLLKYNSNGVFQWYREITDTNYLYLYTNVFAQDSFSNYYFAGFLTHKISNDNDMYLAKTDSLGNLIYMKVFSDPTLNDAAAGICINNKGHIVIGGGGGSHNLSNYASVYQYLKVYELDSSGNILNYTMNHDSNGPYIGNILALKNGEYITNGGYVCDRGHTYISQVGTITKLDSAFNMIWRTDVVPCSIYTLFSSLIEAPDGNFIATGLTYGSDTIFGVDPQYGIIIKISPAGQVIWKKEYSALSISMSSDINVLASVGFLSDSSIITGGEALDYIDAIHPQQGWLLHLDAGGCLPDSNSCGLVNGIADITQTSAHVRAYPNPASEQIRFELLGDEPLAYTLSVIDMWGRTVREVSVVAGEAAMVDVRGWAAGVYVYRVRSVRGAEIGGRFVVE